MISIMEEKPKGGKREVSADGAGASKSPWHSRPGSLPLKETVRGPAKDDWITRPAPA